MPRFSPLIFLISALLLWFPKWSADVVFSQSSIEAKGTPLVFEALPDWVDEVPLKLEESIEVIKNQSREGFVYRLVDLQKNAETGESFFRYADEFLTVAGVQDDAEIVIEYDPAYQTLRVHDVAIHRDGKKLNGAEGALIREVRPEDELDSGLLYGHRKLLIIPAGIRPGDVLEYSYSLTGRNPYYQKKFFDEIEINWEIRVLKTRYRLVKTPERPLFRKNKNTEIQPVKRAFGELEEWIWMAENVPAVQTETTTPKWFDQFATVELSELETWNEVSKLGAVHYRFPEAEFSAELKQTAEKLAADFRIETEQVTAAIRFVQDEIRYVGIEEGGRAYIPISPSVTLKRRFGDCKDKTVLLNALLRQLGISSTPVYVDMDEGRAVAERWPSPLAFDHVVLRIDLKSGKSVYCDCTQTHVGGVAGESIPFPDYHFGLPLFDGEADLTILPETAPAEHGSESLTEIFPGEIGEPALMAAKTTFTGKGANSNRYFAEIDSAEATQLEFLDYYREDYGELSVVEAPQISDERDANELTITESYQIESPWQEDVSDPGWHSLPVFLREIRDQLVQPRHEFRKTPFRFPHPKTIRQEMKIHLPIPEEWEFEDELHFVESPVFTLRREVKFDEDEGILIIRSDYNSLSDHLLPDQLKAHSDAIDSAYELTRYDLWSLDDTGTGGATFGTEDDHYAVAGPADSDDSFVAMAGGAAIGGILGFFVGGGIVGLIWILVRRKRD